MFHIDYKEAKFDNLNTRTENHGDEKMPAADIAITFLMPAENLDLFHKDLRGFLFKKYQNTDAEDMFNGQEEPNEDVIEWRFNDLKKLDWDYEGAGYRFVIWKALQEDDADQPDVARREDVVLINTKVGKVKFSPKTGDTVEVTLRVSGYPNSTEIGRLFDLQGDIIDVTLEPPKV